jgi:hypothetical protein
MRGLSRGSVRAIQGVLDDHWTFFIQLGIYDVVNIEVATALTGRLDLKTEADQDTPDELLFLPKVSMMYSDLYQAKEDC